MNDRNSKNPTNDEIKLQADDLTDLPLDDEQADSARGGAESKGRFESQGRLLIGTEGGLW